MVCTGRSSISGGKKSDYDRPETIEETAALVDELGGVGVAVQVDHLDAGEVRSLAHRIRGDFGGIDILVNDIWGAEVLKGPPPTWNRPIWEHDLDDGLRILRLGIDTHLITSHCLHPLLIERQGGLLVEVTDGTRRVQRRELPAVGVLRPRQDRREPAGVRTRTRVAGVRRYGGRRDTGVAALGDDARQLGCLRGELAYARSTRTAAAICRPHRRDSPSRNRPASSGRGIAAIAADEHRARWNQGSVTSAELAREYGFTDIDGRQPDGWT